MAAVSYRDAKQSHGSHPYQDHIGGNGNYFFTDSQNKYMSDWAPIIHRRYRNKVNYNKNLHINILGLFPGIKPEQ